MDAINWFALISASGTTDVKHDLAFNAVFFINESLKFIWLHSIQSLQCLGLGIITSHLKQPWYIIY